MLQRHVVLAAPASDNHVVLVAAGRFSAFAQDAHEHLAANRIEPASTGAEERQANQQAGPAVLRLLAAEALTCGIESFPDPFEQPVHGVPPRNTAGVDPAHEPTKTGRFRDCARNPDTRVAPAERQGRRTGSTEVPPVLHHIEVHIVLPRERQANGFAAALTVHGLIRGHYRVSGSNGRSAGTARWPYGGQG